MKKILVFLLMSILLMGMTGCGKKAESSVPLQQDKVQETEITKAPTPTEAVVITQAPAVQEEPDEQVSTSIEPEAPAEPEMPVEPETPVEPEAPVEPEYLLSLPD